MPRYDENFQFVLKDGPETKHKVNPGYNDQPSVNFRFGAGTVWDGKPKHESWYA